MIWGRHNRQLVNLVDIMYSIYSLTNGMAECLSPNLKIIINPYLINVTLIIDVLRYP